MIMASRLFAALVLLCSPAVADVHVTNNKDDPDNKLDVRLVHHLVGDRDVTLTGTVTVPPRLPRQFHALRACHDGQGGAPYIEVKPLGVASACPVSRIFSIWGTWLVWPDAGVTKLAQAVQVNHELQNRASFDFIDASISPTTTNGLLRFYGSWGCWPVGYTAAVFLRLETQRILDDDSLGRHIGIAQINVMSGPNMVEGTADEGDPHHRMEVKGLTRVGQTEASDYRRLPIIPGPKENLFGLEISSHSKGQVYCKGFDLMPQPTQ